MLKKDEGIGAQNDIAVGELATEGVLFSVLAVTIVVLQSSSVYALFVLLAIAFTTLAVWHDRYDCWSFLVVAVFGTCADVFFVHYGVWHYSNPDVFGIPLWFPVAFGTSALIGVRLIRTITRVKAFSLTSKE
ncbi:MAG: hypothetical protein ACXW1N_05595 [Halobacteriota archaeon]